MSIYVLRYGDLLKIGFSSDLPSRVANIIASIPGDVTFVGHMPGDRDVEAHLHAVFEAQRFTGEWFKSTAQMEAVLACILLPHMPMRAARVAPNRLPEVEAALEAASTALRLWSSARWPLSNHRARIKSLAEYLPWKQSRIQSIYNAERKTALKPHEALAIDELTVRVGALDSAVGNPGQSRRRSTD